MSNGGRLDLNGLVAAVDMPPVAPDRLAATGGGIARPGPEPRLCQPSGRALPQLWDEQHALAAFALDRGKAGSNRRRVG
jgi:hypothetical protein